VSDYLEIAERFARDTATHQMTVLHDDGLYRHLRFRDRQHSFFWFDIVTTPGQLVFSGDGESFVFRRATDMFEFFRSGLRRNGTIKINPGYWSGKLTSGREAATTYSKAMFEKAVAGTLAAVEDDYPGIAAGWAEHVEFEFNTEYEGEARRALAEFQFGEAHLAECTTCDWSFEGELHTAVTTKAREHRRSSGDEHAAPIRDLSFRFSDMDEVQLQDYDWWFLWACQAIVWGIARYDRVRGYGLQSLASPLVVAA
jgi:hypothetical protein